MLQTRAARFSGPTAIPRHAPALSLPAVMDAERQLGTTLPDDFWAAAAYRLEPFANLGIAAHGPHGEPAPLDDIAETVLLVASDAEEFIDDDDLVPIVDHTKISDDAGGPSYDYLCVRRGVSHAARNSQAVITVGRGGRVERATFGRFLLEQLATDADQDLPATTAIARPELVGSAPPPEQQRRVRHAKFGVGVVRAVTGDGADRKVDVLFEDGSCRVLLERFVTEVSS